MNNAPIFKGRGKYPSPHCFIHLVENDSPQAKDRLHGSILVRLALSDLQSRFSSSSRLQRARRLLLPAVPAHDDSRLFTHLDNKLGGLAPRDDSGHSC